MLLLTSRQVNTAHSTLTVGQVNAAQLIVINYLGGETQVT
jgi:hypothetical protein